MLTMEELLADLDPTKKNRSCSREALRELFREVMKEEKADWVSETKVVSPIVIARIQSELSNFMNDSKITLTGGAALNISVTANLQKSGAGTEVIKGMTREIYDLDFISANPSLEVAKLSADPSVTGLKKVKCKCLVVMDYSGVPVHVKNTARLTNYKLPTQFMVEEASDVNIKVIKDLQVRTVAPEDLIIGKLSASRSEDCIKERKRGVLGTNPPKHILDALTYIYTERKRVSDFFEERREGFEKRIKVSTIESVGALFKDLITMSKKLIGWEYGISERMKGLIAADDSLPIELREAVEAKRDEKAKL
jgi:hypothetical protein